MRAKSACLGLTGLLTHRPEQTSSQSVVRAREHHSFS